ncbi:patatin-like phospholipase family protein [Pusillimonas sp. SM2304]|nr:patatin-like phospholipase family protein [Pusillimonas sp. SM2304]MDS1141069.1 patatin-like phospholipase family protein [Pusillimonas sp. SM2304]
MNPQLELFPAESNPRVKRQAAQASRKRSSTRRLPTQASTEEAALKNANLPANDTPGLPPYETIALVLQGGGALGAYQAGVFQGLQEAGIEPSTLSGISIGALNTAIIAGNPPETRLARLREFWETICQPNFGISLDPFFEQSLFNLNDTVRQTLSALHAGSALLNGQKGFFQPRFPPAPTQMPGDPATASYYDTSALKDTLERLCDFDRINAQTQQVSVGAVNVRTGNFVYFDNTRIKLRAEHFMASGALPPAFAAVEIDGEYYWDGGLVSNTPLTQVLDSRPLRDTLVFQVDLWSARGQPPANMSEVSDRIKDIRYSSRTRMVTEQLRWSQYLRHLLQHLLDEIPADVRDSNMYCRMAQDLACGKRYNVIHLIYRNQPYEKHYKDFQFGLATMRGHWNSGLQDIRQTLADPQRLAMPENASGFVTHDVHREEIEQLMNHLPGKLNGAS